MQRSLFILCFLFTSFLSVAQAPASLNSADIVLNIKKLNVLGSVLYVAAHPDDENTRLLAYLAKEKLYRTGYLSLTRGDGGQNLIGDEQGIDLGLIRTQELLAARRIDGAEQFFTRAFDFGFSKSPEETFTHWNREMILSDAVWVIRKFQPDIIIARFPTTGEGGHGHHTASAIIAQDAFTAAADPNRFPEQLKYVKPWQAKRLLWNTFNFGNTNTQSENQFKIDVGVFNPVLGKGYGEIAAESRSQHKSQGFGVPRQRGQVLEYFKTLRGDAPKEELLDGVDATWTRIENGASIQAMADALLRDYSFINPAASIPALVTLYKAINALPNGYWKERKLKEVTALVEACSGLFADATVAERFAVQTDTIRVNFFVNNRSKIKASVERIFMEGYDSSFKQQTLAPNTNFIINKKIYIPVTKEPTQPYWLREKMGKANFTISNQQLIGDADSKPSYEVRFDITIEGQSFSFTKPLSYKFTDPVKGELYQPLVVIPPVVVSPKTKLLLSFNDKPLTYSADVRALKDVPNPSLKLNTASHWKAAFTNKMIGEDTLRKGIENTYTFSLTPSGVPAAKDSLHAFAGINGNNYGQLMHTINYDHIPYQAYYTPAVSDIVRVNLKTVGKRVGFIEGAGDYTSTALRLMGYEVKILSDNDLQNDDLAKFDAIITGVRAYNIKESMNRHYSRLMSYINNGGTLIVQYNTSNQIGPVKAKISPYPFNISRTRVTDENAPVNILLPEHPVLNFPNKIDSTDFEGWVQERGIYFATEIDPNFKAIFSMNDPGEPASKGSLIISKYGRGHFIYTGLALFRELPAGIPGAYRLLANMIALSKKYL
jgi:LmbE family N-acetylglucosaminyl deacetylase